MKRKINLLQVLPGLLMAGSVALVGCTDSNFDLGDLDKTMAFGSDEGLALPGNNSTHEIQLDDIIDLEEDGPIKLDENDNYKFYKEGDEVDPAHPNIDPITVTENDSRNLPVLLNVKRDGYDLLPDGYPIAPLLNQVISQDIKTFDFNGDKPDEVIDLTDADINGMVSLVINFADRGEDAATPNDLRKLVRTFKTLTFEFPEYMTLDLKEWAPSRPTMENHKLVFTNVPTSQDVVIKAYITKATFDGNGLAIKQVAGKEKEQISMVGNVKITAEYDTESYNKGEVNLDNLRITGQTDLTGQSGTGGIVITGATGRFNPDINIDDVGDITITDVPDFLDDPEVNIVIDNPQIFLSIGSDVDIDGYLNGVITSKFKDGSTEQVTIDDIQIPRNANTTAVICCYDPNGEFAGKGYDVYEETGLRKLISKIPESITFKADAHAKHEVGDEGHIVLGHEYTITPSYKFEAMLAMNEGSRIVYNDTIDGWNEDLEDLHLTANSQVVLTMDVTNNLNEELEMEVQAVDVNANVIGSNDIEVAVGGKVRAAGKTEGFTVTITQKNPDAFKRLDGVKLKAKAISTSDGTPLNAKSQKLKLENISARLKGKVVYEDND